MLALLVIVPGTPLSKDTKLGLDLEGGIELVYEGEPTPQVPEVTPQSIDDAIETMRKRVDSLGVSEPEIQRAGARPDLGRAAGRAERRARAASRSATPRGSSSTTGSRTCSPTARPTRAAHALFQAVEAASTQKGKAEATDVPPGSDMTPAQADKANNTAKDRYYLFGPDELPIGPDKKPLRTGSYEPSGTCKDLLSDYEAAPGPAPKYAKGTECLPQLEALGSGGPPAGSRVIKVPEGVVVVEQEPRAQPAAADQALHGARGRLRAVRRGHQEPQGRHRPEHQRPAGDDGVHRQGARGVRARDQADRASAASTPSTLQPGATDKEQFFQRFAITLDNQIVSLATIDFIRTPRASTGATGAQIENVGDFDDANDLAESLRIGALPIELKLISRDPGLGHARPAGAPPGPDRRRGRPGADDPVPARSSTACSAWWRRRRC